MTWVIGCIGGKEGKGEVMGKTKETGGKEQGKDGEEMGQTEGRWKGGGGGDMGEGKGQCRGRQAVHGILRPNNLDSDRD